MNLFEIKFKAWETNQYKNIKKKNWMKIKINKKIKWTMMPSWKKLNDTKI